MKKERGKGAGDEELGKKPPSSTASTVGATTPGRTSPIRSAVQIRHGPGALSEAVNKLEIGVDDEIALSPRKAPQSKWYHALANLILSIIGAGVLAYPWVLSRLGAIPGFIYMVIVGCVSVYSSITLAYYHQKDDGTRMDRFREVTEYALGPTPAFWLATAPQQSMLVGISIVYIIASGESLGVIYEASCSLAGTSCPELSSSVFTIFFTILCILGSPAPGIHDLWFMSLISSVSCIGYMSLSIYLSLAQIASTGIAGVECDPLPVDSLGFFFEQLSAAGIVVGAYAVTTVLLEIQATLATPPSPFVSMRRGLAFGYSLVIALYLMVAVSGYGAYGDCTSDNILNQVVGSTANWPLLMANLLFSFDSLGSTQLFMQPVVDEVDLFVANMAPRDSWIHEHPRTLRFITGPLLMCILGAIALLFPSLTGVLGLVTSAASIPTTFITPFCIHLSRMKRPKGALRSMERALCILMVIAGTALGIFGVFGSAATLLIA